MLHGNQEVLNSWAGPVQAMLLQLLMLPPRLLPPHQVQ
jgi:hypothetical protein